MRRITRYIVGQVAGMLIFVTVGLTLAIWLSQSLRFVDLIVNKGLPVATFMYLALLLLPRFLTIVLPIALFCAVLFTYNKLMNDRELVVMRAVGLGQGALVRPALMVAFAAMAVLYALNLYLLPVSYRAFKNLYTDIRNEYYSLVLREGTFQDLTDGFTVFVRERSRSGSLVGILVHDSRDPEKPVTYMAESGALISTEASPRVVLLQGNRQEIDPKTNYVSWLYFDRQTLEVDLKRAANDTRWHEPRERFINHLFYPDDSLADRQYAKQIKAEGHQRVIGPLFAITVTLIALACLLHGDVDRRGQTNRVLLAILITTLAQAAGLGLHNLAAKYSEAVPVMYLVAVLPMFGCVYFLRRRPRRSRQMPPADALAVG
ncbi:MAG: LPS export ABC transporter permease LptF [Kiloniellales bacterium]